MHKAERELTCPAGTLVLADLHLHPEHEPRLEQFLNWLASQPRLPCLLLLGDLFDVWVGPAQARQPASARVIQALRECVARGTAIELVPGNRDFLLDSGFERATGVRLWPAGLCLRAPSGERVLGLHGDELCTLDSAYQRMKRILRSRPLRALSRALPLALARRAARGLRQKSTQAVAQKPPETKAMQAAEAERIATLYRASVLVCGHAHEYRQSQLAGGLRWIVLDAWGGERDLLRLEAPEHGGIQAASSRA